MKKDILNSAKIKVVIPNILTILRIILTPIIIVLGTTNHYNTAIILIIIACITDLFDGKLARKWNTVTEIGAKLDVVADKIFAVGLIACLLKKFNLFIPIIILEIFISIVNLYSYFKTNIIKSLLIGKIKTNSLFITVVFGFLCIFFNIFKTPTIGFIYVTINLQIITLINYIITVYDNIQNKKVEQAIVNDKNDVRIKVFDEKPIKKRKKDVNENTKVIENIKDLYN